MSQAKCRRRYILAYPTQFLIMIRLVPGNVVMVATDMYGKSSYGSGYTELGESMKFLPFLFSWLLTMITSVIFIFHNCFAICCCFILRLKLIRLTCALYLFSLEFSYFSFTFTTVIDMGLPHRLERSFLWHLFTTSSRCLL